MTRLCAFCAAGMAGILVADPAFAHVGGGDMTGLMHGFMHPIGGADHVLAMIAVGLLAARLGGRALWLLPLSFMTMMAAGGALGVGGVHLPLAEFAVGLSVVAFGAVIALRIRMPVAIAMALVGFFAIFHGHAHGAEMPDSVSGLEYALGFLSATALLHACGVGLGITLGMTAERQQRRKAPIADTDGRADHGFEMPRDYALAPIAETTLVPGTA